MANEIVAQSITRRNVAAARVACQQRKDWLAAVNRAALNFEACRWAFDGETLVIESATTQGKRYTITASSCECQAFKSGKACWHRAVLCLLLLASEAPVGPEPNPEPPVAVARSWATSTNHRGGGSSTSKSARAMQCITPSRRPRGCYELSTMKVTKRLTISIAKAKKCKPAKVSGNRS